MNTRRLPVLKSIANYPISNDPSHPLADLTNARHLFGDPSNDDDLYGDIDDDPEEGDVNLLAPWSMISGDPDDDLYGDLKSTLAKHPIRNTAIAAAVGAGAGYLVTHNRMKRAYQKKLNALRANDGLLQQSFVKSNLGQIPRNSGVPFFHLTGGTMNSSPIAPNSKFVADTFKYMLDRQALDTPFLQDTAIGTFNNNIWTATASGISNNRYYHMIVIRFGSNALASSPGAVVKITGTFPLIGGGTMSLASSPIIMTYQKGYDVTFMIFPWQIVSNKPLPIMGAYDTTRPVVVNVEGIPQESAMNIVVPGSLHPFVSSMRKGLLRP